MSVFCGPREAYMKEMSNGDLIEELKKRLCEDAKALNDLMVMTRKFEALNDKLRQSESHKSNFLSNIKHEINNPLAAIMDLSNRLEHDHLNQDAAAMAARTIYEKAFALDFQMKNILIAAEIEAGESSMHISCIDVARLIQDLLKSFNHRITVKKLQSEFVMPKGEQARRLYFNTDPSKLSCICANLLANAIEFNKEGGAVRIKAAKQNDQLTISVADNGIGISKQDGARIFQRFAQIDTGKKRRQQGYGLGLCITKALAEILGGKVVFSCSSGKGCIFTVSIKEAGMGEQADGIPEDGMAFVLDNAEKY